ncbi:putative leucine-rich repeat-containing protein DDB_G0290503 [Labeo rohita]|uniref:putative leucine-rich repeat-containing protein DDB_G0290503 n=1 Tax=Labeo rohita TaxID=84645 RepID=UPI0021E26807|nr:putative leucine-rich repeat-containing protein DDB_G0290503 [Labeo rohita]
MELDIHYVNFENSDTECRTLPKIPSQSQDAGKAQKCRRSGCLVLIAIAMCFVLLICGVLLVFVILQHISITADKGQSKTYKDTIQVFNETINRLQNSYSDLMTKKDQLQEKFNVMSDELNKAYHKAENNLSKNYKDTIQVFNETMNRLQDSCSNLRTNKDQLQDKFNIMSDELKKAYQKG